MRTPGRRRALAVALPDDVRLVVDSHLYFDLLVALVRTLDSPQLAGDTPVRWS